MCEAEQRFMGGIVGNGWGLYEFEGVVTERGGGTSRIEAEHHNGDRKRERKIRNNATLKIIKSKIILIFN